MTLENQVVSLELAKKLKELGVEQESIFYWCTIEASSEADIRPAKSVFGQEILLGHSYNEEISAFTVAELGEMLPEYVGEWFLEMYKDSSNLEGEEWYLVRYIESDGVGGEIIKKGFNEKTEADARAKMLLYLIENKLYEIN